MLLKPKGNVGTFSCARRPWTQYMLVMENQEYVRSAEKKDMVQRVRDNVITHLGTRVVTSR